MSESDKPFVCNFVGCGQMFANHDHLSNHQQKHEFSLRFSQGDALLVDQTPTPTRFLRIGEKIGLFQELEEATCNPFDQDFKTATSSKSQTKAITCDQDLDGKHDISPASGEDSFSSRAISTAIPVAPPANLVNPDKPVPMATVPAHINTASALTKQKLLQTIQMKEQQKLLEQTIARQLGQPPELLAQALKNMLPMSESSTQLCDERTFLEPADMPTRRRGRKPDDEDPEVKRQRFLERNRAAASRCRAKKKVWVDNLEDRVKELEVSKQNLSQEVSMLRSEVQQLKSILIAHKDCPLIVHQQAAVDVSEPEVPRLRSGVTLLSQLASMPSMSPLIDSPVPSVGSVVPNMQQSMHSSMGMANGLSQQQQQLPEVAKDVEISNEMEAATATPLSEQ